ncbi:MAG: hypothetical protein RLZZ06_1096 [Actinomycetota bacterium]|jgi:hypothetical protein
MAKKNENKEPGQVAQIIMVLKRTIELDRKNLWIILGTVITVLGTGIGFSVALFASGNILTGILLIIFTILATFIAFSLVLSRRAEKAAYNSWEGQLGAVGAVLQTLLRRTYRGSDQPVAVNPRSRDAVYRIVGPSGVILVGEGHQSGSQILVDAERKKLSKVAPGVPVHSLYVTESSHALKLAELRKAIRKLPKQMKRAEIKVVAARLAALGINLPIPKGIDPRRARPVRK